MTEFKLDSEKINLFFNGKYSDEDARYINETFCDNSKEEELKHHLLRQFYELPIGKNVENKNLDHILHKIHYNINTRSADRKASLSADILKWTFRIAGFIILPLVIFFAVQFYKNASAKKEAWVEIKAPAWTRAQFSLPDGTTGWLNSSSTLKYNVSFNSHRQVTLNGEAFFDVFKDKKRPFVVNTPELNIKVLGTRFNIASYENEKNVEVVLEEGKIILENKKMDRSFPMEGNELYVYDKSQYNCSTKSVDVQKYISWTAGKLVFRNDPLEVIAKRLERWYNIDVEVDSSSTEDFTWRATFVDEGLEGVLDMLKRSLPLNYKIENQYLKPDETYSKKKVIITFKTK
jgi:ferric-dicitrate binding protein FerR (iron transport regulator)